MTWDQDYERALRAATEAVVKYVHSTDGGCWPHLIPADECRKIAELAVLTFGMSGQFKWVEPQ